MPTERDKIFVELAVKNHLLTQAEAEAALVEADAKKKEVSALLVEKGVLKQKHVDSLTKRTGRVLEERFRAPEAVPTRALEVSGPLAPLAPPSDPSPDAQTRGPGVAPFDPSAPVLFGQVATRLGFIVKEDVEAALARQRELEKLGAKRRIGEVLCDRKKLDPDKVRQVLGYQEKFILACPKCQKRYNVQGSSSGARCPSCSSELKPSTTIGTAGVAGSIQKQTDSSGPNFVNSQQSLATARRKTDADPAGLLNSEFNGHRIEKVLGRGGMGCVYLATQLSLERKVALKVMLRAGSAKEEEKQRFRREMRILANVRHRYILPVYLAGIEDDLWWYTMKFVKGRSFKDALASGRFAISKGARVVMKVCRGMHFAHDNGVIHRDLKPQNVMLERDDTADENDPNAREEPQILDFGLAKALDAQTMANLTQMGAFLGTPAYMAPEQAGGDPSQLDGRADVYALGAILYEVLTGRPPFTGTSPANIIKKVLSEDPVPPRQVFAHAPATLEPIAMKALIKDRDERYQSAEEMAAAIEAVLGPETEPPFPASKAVPKSESPEQKPTHAEPPKSEEKKPTKRGGLFGKLFGDTTSS